MKKVILSVIVVMFVTFVSASDRAPKPTATYSETNKEIEQILEDEKKFEQLNDDVVVKVQIELNEKREITVLNTTSTDSDLVLYITKTLNNKKINANELETGVAYVVPLSFKKI